MSSVSRPVTCSSPSGATRSSTRSSAPRSLAVVSCPTFTRCARSLAPLVFTLAHSRHSRSAEPHQGSWWHPCAREEVKAWRLCSLACAASGAWLFCRPFRRRACNNLTLPVTNALFTLVGGCPRLHAPHNLFVTFVSGPLGILAIEAPPPFLQAPLRSPQADIFHACSPFRVCNRPPPLPTSSARKRSLCDC